MQTLRDYLKLPSDYQQGYVILGAVRPQLNSRREMTCSCRIDTNPNCFKQFDSSDHIVREYVGKMVKPDVMTSPIWYIREPDLNSVEYREESIVCLVCGADMSIIREFFEGFPASGRLYKPSPGCVIDFEKILYHAYGTDTLERLPFWVELRNVVNPGYPPAYLERMLYRGFCIRNGESEWNIPSGDPLDRGQEGIRRQESGCHIV